MSYTHAFTARVQEQIVAGNTSKEFEKFVSLKQTDYDPLLGILVICRLGKRTQDADPKISLSSSSKYPLSNCIKITPWKSVEKTGNLAVHFEKSGKVESKEVRRARRSGKLGRPGASFKTGRTKVTIISVRGWSLEDFTSVKEIWEVLNQVAVHNQLLKPMERSHVSSDRITLRTSVVDEKTRKKERNRYTEDHRMLSRGSHSSLGPLSQGQKMINALSMGSQQRGGRYSALSRAAKGDSNFSYSLIGSPNLKDFDKNRSKSVRHLSAGKHRVCSDLSNHSEPLISSATSILETPGKIDVDCILAPSQPLRKRQRENTTSTEVAVKRKKYLSEQLKSRKVPSPIATPRRSLRSNLQSLPLSSPFKTVPASGIANEGNTCYLSAVVQALMCDRSLIALVGKRAASGSSMPFSVALTSMAQSRDSSKTLKPGLIRQAVSKHFPQFSSSDQQDAHEFFLRCLDIIAKECTLSDFRDSPTHTNYSLVQERKFTCTKCGHQTKPRREILRGLSLDVPHGTGQDMDGLDNRQFSLQNLLDSFFASQDLVLDCECCDGKHAKSDTKLVLTPRSLVLHIKRFGVDYHHSNGAVSIKKITDCVTVPEKISLDSVLAQNACSSEVVESRTKIHSACPRKEIISGIDDSGKSLPARTIAACISPPKSPDLDPSTQYLSAPSTSPSKRPRAVNEPFNFARRFRVHADEPKDNRETDRSVGIINQKSDQTCRLLQVDDDEIEDDNKISVAPFDGERNIGYNANLKAITALGITEPDAKKILQQANHDMTRAMGMALDKRHDLNENPNDLDEDLLNYIARSANEHVSHVTSQAKGVRYRLAAVIRHHSDSANRGHYVADVLQPDGSWFCYDDSSVFRMSSTKLQDREGYLCWYLAD